MAAGFKTLRSIRLGPQHAATGKTRHYRGSLELAPPRELRIAHYADEPGYYLLYLDEAGDELTDTYHDTLAEAMGQAEWEFGIRPDEWQTLEGEVP